MSQLVLDDQLDLEEVLPLLEGWISSVRLQDLRPGEHILDDRVPEILLTLKKPTFVTIDHGFWRAECCHRSYCILYFALTKNQQAQLQGPVVEERRQDEASATTQSPAMDAATEITVNDPLLGHGRPYRLEAGGTSP